MCIYSVVFWEFLSSVIFNKFLMLVWNICFCINLYIEVLKEIKFRYSIVYYFVKFVNFFVFLGFRL